MEKNNKMHVFKNTMMHIKYPWEAYTSKRAEIAEKLFKQYDTIEKLNKLWKDLSNLKDSEL